jgi:hypothetical protein
MAAITKNRNFFKWPKLLYFKPAYVKLISAVTAILVGVLKCRTQSWKRTTQESFQQSLVEIGSVVHFFFTCNFEVNLIAHLGVLALFSSNL